MDITPFLSKYIAPWALSKESIPIHFHWDEAWKVDEINITLPDSIMCSEFFNVDEYIIDNHHISIKKLKTSNYFGIMIRSTKIIDETHVTEQVVFDFVEAGRVKHKEILKANIFRPVLKAVNVPEIFVITDKTENPEINILLQLSGFGKINIKSKISSGGRFKEKAEPLYEEFVRRMISIFRTDNELKENRMSIDPLYLQTKANEYIAHIENGKYPIDIDRDDINEFKKWMSIEENKDKIMDLMTRQIENILLDSLVSYFDRNPADEVRLPQGKPEILIENVTKEVRLILSYSDSILNEYEALEFKVDIEDQREDRKNKLSLSVNLKFEYDIINPMDWCKRN
jgi:hypothetical protein